jgi:hypothetical protein
MITYEWQKPKKKMAWTVEEEIEDLL